MGYDKDKELNWNRPVTQAIKHFPLNANVQFSSLFLSHGQMYQLY